MKLCLLYNYAQHYRTSIFTLIDRSFDTCFVFGDKYLNIKRMDYSLLRGKVFEVRNKHFFGLSYQSDIIRFLNKDFDSYIILGEVRSISTWLFCLIARLFYSQKRIYFWSHGWYGKESWPIKLLKRFFFSLPNGGVFLYGNYARELMIREGFKPEKLFVIHNSLAYAEQIQIRQHLTKLQVFHDHFNNDNFNLIFVGRLTNVKRLDMVLMALASLRERDKERQYNFTFIGGGESLDLLKSLTIELGLQDRVWFYGPCYDELSLGHLIYNADLCVSPGNVGLTAMHSMVYGTPVLTHNDFPHQMPEFEAIREGITGTFFNNGDVISLADSISDWFANKSEKREEVRKACMKEIDENWTPQFQIEVLKNHLT